MKCHIPLLLVSTLALTTRINAQTPAQAVSRGATLSPNSFDALAVRCAPGAPLVTVRSLVEVESRFNPFAVNINYPEAAARQLGLGEGAVTLSQQPSNVDEAVKWSRWLLSKGQTVSVGLTQLNIEHLATHGISLENAFDPCTNLRVGWAIFSEKYTQAVTILGRGNLAMQTALSAYNSGTLFGGFRNGYIDEIIRHQPAPVSVAESSPPLNTAPAPADAELLNTVSAAASEESEAARPSPPPPNPRTADTAIPWDTARAATPWPPSKID